MARFISKRLASKIGKPEIDIDPSIKSNIIDAVNKLKGVDPNYFKGVDKIVGTTEGTYGKTDGTTIYINYPKVVEDVKSRLGDLSEEENKKKYDALLMESLVRLISHEVGHVEDYDEERGFPGGEGVADQESEKMINKVKNKG